MEIQWPDEVSNLLRFEFLIWVKKVERRRTISFSHAINILIQSLHFQWNTYAEEKFMGSERMNQKQHKFYYRL